MIELIYEKTKIVLFVIILPFLTLTACETADYDTSKSTSLVLPPVIPYSREFQNQLADEAEGGSCPAHTEIGKDYKLTRDKIRVAQEQLK